MPDLSQPAFSDRTWENYTPRITWQINAAQQDLRSPGTSSRSAASAPARRRSPASPNFIFPTSPEADGHGEFSPQRVQQVRWTSPLTNRLLLEAGFGTTYYEWGGKELDPNPTQDLVQRA